MITEDADPIIQKAVDAGDPQSAERGLLYVDHQLSTASVDAKSNLLLHKAIFLGILSRFDEAREQLEIVATEFGGDALVALQRDFVAGCLYGQEGRFADAYKILTSTLYKYREQLQLPELRFIFEDIQQRRAFDLFQVEQYGKAEYLLREALTYKMKSADRIVAVVELGICYSRLNDHELALKYLQEASQAGLPQEWYSEAHFYLGLTLAHLKRLAESKQEFLLSLQTRPTPQVYAWLAKICDLLGDTEEAQHYAQIIRPS
jgi:tetratricopeptide (TPR) repeat protein